MLSPYVLLFRRYAAPEVARRLSPERVAAVFERTDAGYRSRLPELPREETLGARGMLRLAAVAAAFYQALLDEDLDAAEARAMTAAALWPLYDSSLVPLSRLARKLQPDPRRRLEGAIDRFRRHVFNPPGWQVEGVPLPEPQAGVGFDIHRCPLADYLRPEGLGELCVEAFCKGDELIAERLGVILRREGTIAGGADRCDFRWLLPE